MKTPRSDSFSPRWASVVVVLLLLLLFLQATLSMRLMSATSDETTHLASGYTYLRTGQLRLNPQHPPLVKMLCALPLVFLAPPLDLTDPAWTNDPPDEWQFGIDFLYANDADRLLFWGRLPVVLLALVLGIYVYRWSRSLFGIEAGLVALFLYVFCPNVVAHSRFVTFDMGLSCFFLATLFHLWRFVKQRRGRDLMGAGIALGLAMATKFSAIFLVPIVALLLAVAAARDRDDSLPWITRLRRAGACFTLLLGIAAVLLWIAFLFPSDPLFYWKGVRLVNADRLATYYYYLLGDFRQGGWWYYSLVAFLVKTPVPTLLLFGCSLVLAGRYRTDSWIDELFLGLPVIVFAAATCAFASNLGIRYLLPIYPLVFIFISRLAPMMFSARAGRAAAVGLALWYSAASLWIYPDYLGYFNEAVGGPAQGHKYLDDSNLDWGQDLKQLKAYLGERKIDRIKLLCAWNAPPDYYGITWDDVTETEWTVKPTPGLYAISTHFLIRGELLARERGLKTDWLKRYEPIDRVGTGFYIFRFD